MTEQQHIRRWKFCKLWAYVFNKSRDKWCPLGRSYFLSPSTSHSNSVRLSTVPCMGHKGNLKQHKSVTMYSSPNHPALLEFMFLEDRAENRVETTNNCSTSYFLNNTYMNVSFFIIIKSLLGDIFVSMFRFKLQQYLLVQILRLAQFTQPTFIVGHLPIKKPPNLSSLFVSKSSLFNFFISLVQCTRYFWENQLQSPCSRPIEKYINNLSIEEQNIFITYLLLEKVYLNPSPELATYYSNHRKC